MTPAINPNPRPFEPWDHQLRAYRAIGEGVEAGHRRQLICSPTGSGKTVLSMLLARTMLRQDKPVVFMADRIVLIDQTSRTAYNYGLQHGIHQGAGHPAYAPDELFQIASAQTIKSRGKWPRAKLVLIDEVHTVHSIWRDRILQAAADDEQTSFVGLTATPFTKGLGKLFTNLVNAATMHELVESGHLVPMRVKSCKPINMDGAATSGGEWTDTAASERALQIVGDVVSDWLEFGENRKTIAFGPTIKYAQALCQQFNDAGVMAACITKDTKGDERRALLQEFAKPDSELRILLSVVALAKGFDQADVSCVIDCRPLRKSLSEVIQMWGRGLRIAPDSGKTDMLLLDHSGNVGRFGADFERFYFNGVKTLDDGEKLDAVVRKEPPEFEKRGCPKCGFTPFAQTCMKCGYERPVVDKVQTVAGIMQDVVVNGKGVTLDSSAIWSQICGYVSKTKSANKHGYAAHLFKEIVGRWPPHGARYEITTPTPPSAAIAGKIRSRNIAMAKAREKAAQTPQAVVA